MISQRVKFHFAFVLACAVLARGEPEAQFRALGLPAIFSDGMVLQRHMPVNIWGWAPPGAAVTVAFAEQSVQTVADAGGRWRLRLEPLEASLEARRLTVSAPGAPDVVVNDVLVGEVWFTAGQSNMVMGMGAATGGREFFERHAPAAGGRIRVVMQGAPTDADTPREDVPARRASRPSTSFTPTCPRPWSWGKICRR